MIRLLKRHWPLICIILCLLILGIYFYNAKGPIRPEIILNTEHSGAGSRIQNFHLTEEDPQRGLKWTLDAQDVTASTDQNLVTFKIFQLKLESKDHPAMVLKGGKGNLDRHSESIEMQDGVLAEAEDQYRFQTEYLVYHMKQGLITTTKSVKLEGPYFTVEGRGLVVDLQKETFKIQKHLKTEIHHGLVL